MSQEIIKFPFNFDFKIVCKNCGNISTISNVKHSDDDGFPNSNHNKNPYKVNREDIQVGDTYFIFHNRCFYEILIGNTALLNLDRLYVNFPNEEKIRITIDELYTQVPKNWTGKVISFSDIR